MLEQYDEVARLLHDVPLPPGESLPAGADHSKVGAAFQRIGVEPSDALVAWLGVCNGPCVGPGGLFGVDTERESLDIEHVMVRFPNWADLGWIPIAGDGSGNYFVLLPNPYKDVVAFIDTSLNPNAVGYVVASDLARFLVALLTSELEHDGQWLFNRAAVLANDPGLESVAEQLGLPVPWEADP
jgi:hypothetical protein